MYPATTCWGLATECSSNGKIVYDGFLSESFNILMLIPKAFEVACIGAISAHSLSADKFETYLSKLPTAKFLYRFWFLITSCTASPLSFWCCDSSSYNWCAIAQKKQLPSPRTFTNFKYLSLRCFCKFEKSWFFILENFIFVKHAISTFVDVIFLVITRCSAEIHFPLTSCFVFFFLVVFILAFYFLLIYSARVSEVIIGTGNQSDLSFSLIFYIILYLLLDLSKSFLLLIINVFPSPLIFLSFFINFAITPSPFLYTDGGCLY